MHTSKTGAQSTSLPATAPQGVPMLDVCRENSRLANELNAAMTDVAKSGAFVHGPACHKFEAEMAQYCGTEHAIGCASGSDALLLVLMALGVGPGDEVIVPSFTFFATASAVWRLGAKPVFADIKPDTFNLNPADVLYKMSTATKAIIPVHLFGQCAEMDEIRQIASAARGIPIIEDSCQAIGSEYGGVRTGSLGTAACFSFYPTKNLGGFGDGGVITTNDAELAAHMKVLRDHGAQPRYYHHYVGLNSRLDALQAAVLSVKLPHLDNWAAARKRHAERYQAEFKQRGLGVEVVAPVADKNCHHVWNQYTVRVKNGRRDLLQKFLADRKIGSAIYYPVPLHLQKCFAALGYEEGSLPVTEQACREVLSLPVYPELTATEQGTVIDAVSEFCQARGRAAA
ncbi:MAG TPA: DegT/DnrJ/EryC1/StrS family aminotransferase [Lacipirellulaceae bacterium]|jgi:dTDP-4-amino-4,6-dideoxygalactose transaminase|nr:DegT/DnrJ/EryC1/StrS family aminotransferase [Lacipirellulaceae bacterium]